MTSVLDFIGAVFRDVFYQVGCLFGLMAICGFVLHQLERITFGIMLRVWSWDSVIYSTGWLGTPVHELSHVVGNILGGHRVTDVELFNPDPVDGTLGYVKYE